MEKREKQIDFFKKRESHFINSKVALRRFDYRTICLSVSVLCLSACVFAFFAGISEHCISYLLILSLFLVVMIPLVLNIGRKPVDALEIIYLIGFLYFLYFGIRALFVLNTGWDPRLQFVDVINIALLYTIIGFIALLKGYYSNISRLLCSRLPTLHFHIVRNRMIILIYALWGIACLLRFYIFSTGLYARWVSYTLLGVPSWFNSIVYLSIFLGRFGYTLAIIYYFSELRTKRLFFFSFFLWFVIFPTEIGWCFLGGEKKFLIYAIITPLFTYHYLKRRVPFTYLMVAFLLIGFVVFPIVNAYRAVGNPFYLQETDRYFGYLFTEVFSYIRPFTFSNYFIQGAEKLIWRFPGIDSLVVIIKSVPGVIDFQWGATIFSKVVIIVPKFLLEAKDDIIKQGFIFNQNYFGISFYSDFPITQIGELYLNFHILGILLGMFFLGIMYRIVYLYFIINSPSPIKLFIYLPLFFTMANIEGDLGIVYMDFLRQLILLLIIARFLNKGRLLWPKGKLEPSSWQI